MKITVSWYILTLPGNVLKIKMTSQASQKMFDKAVEKCPWLLVKVPDHFITQEMCKKVVRIEPILLCWFPDHLKTQEMCNHAVRNGVWVLFVSDHFKTQ